MDYERETMTPEEITKRLKDRSTWADGWEVADLWPVRILADDVPYTDFCVVGLIEKEAPIPPIVMQWRLDGTPLNGATFHRLQRRPVKHKGWLNIFKRDNEISCGFLRDTKENALGISHGSPNLIACIEIEFTEGQGL